jgi:hypothetical protein
MPDTFIIYSKKVPVFWKPTFRKKALSSCSRIKVYEETFKMKATHSLEMSGTTEESSVASQNTATLHHIAVLMMMMIIIIIIIMSTTSKSQTPVCSRLRFYQKNGRRGTFDHTEDAVTHLKHLGTVIFHWGSCPTFRPTLHRVFKIFFPSSS